MSRYRYRWFHLPTKTMGEMSVTYLETDGRKFPTIAALCRHWSRHKDWYYEPIRELEEEPNVISPRTVENG